ncbi:C40 family peptidase [Actinokineospora sp. UTMC 2448]|uniref:C40 family peptidase n=1 Tax=Actinokineospora sp. UTMC 2448 TaxID=2268449 RepID=UPI002164A4D5|nr:NlpC/P60 family protein [Actinokineospora sp. UTMC 2448]UVS80585.1 Peptidoglycan endopeptidase RipA precursor [Actinokineospora sp. UTMC 2448]
MTAAEPVRNAGSDMTSAVGRGKVRLCITLFLLPCPIFALLVISILVTEDEALGAGALPCAPEGASPEQLGPFGPDQLHNARTIVAIGKRRAIPDEGIVIALMAAMTESSLRNLNHGDRDSLGLFQMRPSMGWGTPTQVMDPDYATNKFYDTLLDVPQWETLPLGAAAQAVERSAYPDRYARFEQIARQVLVALSDTTCSASASDLPPNPDAHVVVTAALSQLGVPYAWGGGNASGPTMGTGVDQGIVGFDCSGLAVYAYAQINIPIPHQTQAIWHAFQPAITNPNAILPGDLILLSHNGKPSGIHHLGIYLGNGRVVHAPESGDVVKVSEEIWQSPYWSREFIGAVRPGVG